MTVDVWWQATQEDDADFVGGTKKQLTLLPGEWANSSGNAESVASDVLADYFDTGTWEESFGLDESEATVRLRIHSPDAITGDYIVGLERVTQARARRVASPQGAEK